MGPIAAKIGLIGLLRDQSQVPKSCSAVTVLKRYPSNLAVQCGAVTSTPASGQCALNIYVRIEAQCTLLCVMVL